MQRLPHRSLVLTGAFGVAAIAVAVAAGPVSAHESDDQSRSLTTSVFATSGAIPGGKNVGKPDDITLLEDSIFVSWQNGVGPKGEPAGAVTDSTVVQYSKRGRVLNSWQLTGRCDGLSADPEHERLIATVNEDGNSSLYVIRPDAPAGSQLSHFTYNPGQLVHGGGTDAPHIYRGELFISASNPSDATQPAVYHATFAGSTINLAPVLFDDSSATVANTNSPTYGSQTTLGLGDPDSNNVVPRSSPRFGGDFLLDSQGDGQHIYVHDAGRSTQKLYLLTLSSVDAGPSTAVDDTVWATSSRGTLYATDGSSNVYAIRGRFVPGTAFSAVSPANANTPSTLPNFLATLNLKTGALTRLPTVTIRPKGLLFVKGAGGGDNSDD